MNNDYKQLLENLMLTVQRENASDLHLSPGRKPIMRVEGELIPLVNRDELTKEDTFGMLKEIVNQSNLEKIKNLKRLILRILFMMNYVYVRRPMYKAVVSI